MSKRSFYGETNGATNGETAETAVSAEIAETAETAEIEKKPKLTIDKYIDKYIELLSEDVWKQSELGRSELANISDIKLARVVTPPMGRHDPDVLHIIPIFKPYGNIVRHTGKQVRNKGNWYIIGPTKTVPLSSYDTFLDKPTINVDAGWEGGKKRKRKTRKRKKTRRRNKKKRKSRRKKTRR